MHAVLQGLRAGVGTAKSKRMRALQGIHTPLHLYAACWIAGISSETNALNAKAICSIPRRRGILLSQDWFLSPRWLLSMQHSCVRAYVSYAAYMLPYAAYMLPHNTSPATISNKIFVLTQPTQDCKSDQSEGAAKKATLGLAKICDSFGVWCSFQSSLTELPKWVQCRTGFPSV